MAGVDVHGHVGKVELFERVVDALVVRRLRVGALGDVEVGHHVGERVGLDDEQRAHVAVGHELRADRVDVRLVVGHAVVCDAVLTVGGGGGALWVEQVVVSKCRVVSCDGSQMLSWGFAGSALGNTHITVRQVVHHKEASIRRRRAGSIRSADVAQCLCHDGRHLGGSIAASGQS